MIRAAIIGYGMAAQTFHLPLLSACREIQAAAVVSRQSNLPLPQRSLEAVLADAAIDLCIITTPNDTHAPIARRCIEAGKAVVVEKPMALDFAEAQSIFAAAKRRGVLCAVFHNRRLDGDFLTVRQLLAQNRLGTVRTFRSHWDRFRPEVRNRWRENPGAGSGIWYDLAPHLLDQTLQLFGTPQALTARLRPLRPHSGSDDYAHVLLHYADKEIILHTSPYGAAPTPRFVIEGDGGTFVKYGLDGQEAQLKAGLTPADTAFGCDDPAADGKLYLPDGSIETLPTLRGRFGDFYPDIARAIKNGEAPTVKEDEALAVMRLMDAARGSAATGKTVRL